MRWVEKILAEQWEKRLAIVCIQISGMLIFQASAWGLKTGLNSLDAGLYLNYFKIILNYSNNRVSHLLHFVNLCCALGTNRTCIYPLGRSSYIFTRHIAKYLCPHSESNGDLFLRTELFYPLNYGGNIGRASLTTRANEKVPHTCRVLFHHTCFITIC
jgi:hypothetical protein